MSRAGLYWIPALVVMAAIAVLSHRSDLPDLPGGPPDWLLHGMEYGVLAAACAFGATRGFVPERRKAAAAATATVIAAGYGVLDEWHQSFVPGRDPSLMDWLADLVGAALVSTLLLLCWRACRAESPRL